MKILRDTAFEVGTRVWSVDPPKPSMMVAVKATFDLVNGGLALPSATQEPLTEGIYHNDDPSQTVRYASDYAFLKKQAELLLMGEAHAPGGREVTQLQAQVSVGGVTSRLAIFGDRYWKIVGGRPELTPPEPFTAMPLRWERAFGGPSLEANPEGVGLKATAAGRIPLPNIEDPEDLIVDPRSRPRPAGAFPLPSTWPGRAALLGTCDERWRKQRFPFPAEDFDPEYFNAAPRDLRFDGAFADDAPIALYNLVAEAPELVTRLPGLHPRAIVEWEPERGWGLSEVPLQLDTVTIDTDGVRALCLWRGLIRIPGEAGEKLEPSGVARLLVLDEPSDQRSSLEACRDRVADRGRSVAGADDALQDAAEQSQELWTSVEIDVGSLDETGYEPSIIFEPWTTGEVSAVQIQTGEIPAFSKLTFAISKDAVEEARHDPALAVEPHLGTDLSPVVEPDPTAPPPRLEPVIAPIEARDRQPSTQDEQPKLQTWLTPIVTPVETPQDQDSVPTQAAAPAVSPQTPASSGQTWLTPVVTPSAPLDDDLSPTQTIPAITLPKPDEQEELEPTSLTPAITPEMLASEGLQPARTEVFSPPEEEESEATVMLDVGDDAEETSVMPPIEAGESEETSVMPPMRVEDEEPLETAEADAEEEAPEEAPKPSFVPIECKIKNLTPFVVGTKLTSVEPPRPSLTVVVRGRFDMVGGGVAILSERRDQRDGLSSRAASGGLLADDDGLGEVLSPDDMADFKPRTDLLLRGCCHTPGGKPLPRCPVGFQVGRWKKALWVVGQRTWREGFFGAKASEPIPFRRMSLSYSHSFGGPGFPYNPVGLGFGNRELPNIESPAEPIRTPRDQPAPAGFGPINAEWFPRFSKRGRKRGADWLRTKAPAYPDDFDWSFFNEAPEDQQLEGYLKGDEWLKLQNIHRTEPNFETRLPGLRLRCFVEGGDEGFSEVQMNLDTLMVDADKGQVLLTWRGVAPVEDSELEDVGSLLIDSEPSSEKPKDLDHYRELSKEVAASPISLTRDLSSAELALYEAKLRGDDEAAAASSSVVARQDQLSPRVAARSIVRPHLEVVRDTPFQAGWQVWTTRKGQSCLTAVVKGTFDLSEKGRCFISTEQAPLAGDLHPGGDLERSPRTESDLANIKLRGECFVVGSCYAPGGEPVGSLTAAFKIGPVVKAMAVFGDRRLDRDRDFKGPPEPFTVMPLCWERAFGGPASRRNPDGRGFDDERMPNFEDPDDLIIGARSRPKPICSVAIPRSWPVRAKLSGLEGDEALAETWLRLSDGFDMDYFNAAPPDQRISGFFRGDEEISLVNLHPELPKLRCRLPDMAAVIFLKEAGRESLRPLTAELDTITVDTDTGKVFCLWRAVTELPSASLQEFSHLFVTHQMRQRPRSTWDLMAAFKENRGASPRP